MNLTLKHSTISVAVALTLGAGLPLARAGNYCFLGPGMGCGNTSGMADSTTVGPGVGPAPPEPSPAWGGQSTDALAQAINAAENGQLPTYAYFAYGQPSPPGGWSVLEALARGPAGPWGYQTTTPQWEMPTWCAQGNVPYLLYNGSSYALLQSEYNLGCSCFPAGARVLMADGSERPIQFVRTGDWLMGADGRPVQVRYVDRPLLGNRRMMAFADGSQVWSEEHGFWTRDVAGAEWWWSANPDQWRFEAETGHIGGLHDNASMRAGDGYEFAHLKGWTHQVVVEAEGYGPDTQLYLPRTDGVPIIVNGYVVGAGVNEEGYDYKTLRWNPQAVYDTIGRLALGRVLARMSMHAAKLPGDPIERMRRLSRLGTQSLMRMRADAIV